VPPVEPLEPAEDEDSEEDNTEDDKAVGEGGGSDGDEDDDDKEGDDVQGANDHESERGEGNVTPGELHKADRDQATSLIQIAPEGDIEMLDGTTATRK